MRTVAGIIVNLIQMCVMTLSLTLGVNREFNSNVIDESDLQFEKQFDPRISTLLGIRID
jgi:hypothetical protein